MRVLHVVDYFCGGAQRVAVSLASGFPGSAIASFCKVSTLAFPDVLENHQIAYHAVDSAADVERLMRDFDICHVHWWSGSEADTHLDWQNTPYPIVATVHGAQVFPYPDIHFICVGAGQADLQNRPCHVIPNGFDLDRFAHPRVYGERLNIGFVSCLNGKIEDNFAALAKNALSKVANPYTFIVVGDGSSLPHFRSCVNALGWPVRFDGMRWDIAVALAEMDVFLYPTRMDVLPTVVIEAMASGLPVVSPPVGEIPAMLADGRGYALTWGDMPDVLANLCADSGLREHIGQSAQRYALSNYSHGAMLERHLALYEEIINGD